MAKVDAEKTSSDFALPPSLVGAAKITLSVLKELMTGVPVPFVQGVAGTAVKIIEILEVRLDSRISSVTADSFSLEHSKQPR
jgi:hypothetical protein